MKLIRSGMINIDEISSQKSVCKISSDGSLVSSIILTLGDPKNHEVKEEVSAFVEKNSIPLIREDVLLEWCMYEALITEQTIAVVPHKSDGRMWYDLIKKYDEAIKAATLYKLSEIKKIKENAIHFAKYGKTLETYRPHPLDEVINHQLIYKFLNESKKMNMSRMFLTESGLRYLGSVLPSLEYEDGKILFNWNPGNNFQLACNELIFVKED